ncbi:MAG: hypothetical protein AAGJ81_04460 [Verrucomicrobiota bacterium]
MDEGILRRRLLQLGLSESSCKDFAGRFALRFGGSGEIWDKLVLVVDESDYGWPEWLEAITLLDEKVSKANGGPVSLTRMIGYIDCVAEGARSARFLEPLPEVTIDAFESYGFEVE